MRLSAAVLAHTTHNASLVTTPKVNRCKLKHIELISIHDNVALLILVLQEGTIKQQILNLEDSYTQDELRSISRQLTELWANCGVNSITATTTSASLIGLSSQVASVVIDTMRRLNARETSQVYHDGLLHLLETDLSDSDALQQIIRILEEQRTVDQLIGQVLTQKGIQIIIGGEGKWDDLSQVSIVLSRYGIDDGVSGALGVVGPIRMAYGRAISIVRYMSLLMSNLLSDLYGPQSS
jgi:heat-inducible transcriptional repressor